MGVKCDAESNTDAVELRLRYFSGWSDYYSTINPVKDPTN